MFPGGVRVQGMVGDLLTQLWHTAALYVLAFIVFRLMGKRSISHIAPFNIAVVVITGDPNTLPLL